MYTKPVRALPDLVSRYKVHVLLYLTYLVGIYVAYEFRGHEQLDISMSIATVLGFAVALLLGFRTQQCYDRWWEARKIWGAIVNDSRSLIRQLIGYVGNDQDEDIRRMASYMVAWCISLKDGLRGLSPLEEIKGYVSEEELEHLKTVNNVHNEVLKYMEVLLSSIREKGKIDKFQFVSVDATLKGLCDSMGKCERIRNTVFPVQYRSYLKAGIWIFTLMLPYGMLYSTGPFMILICFFVAVFFLMIENIANHLQDPFKNFRSDIPMTALSRTIEINLLQMVKAKNVPKPIQPDSLGVLM